MLQNITINKTLLLICRLLVGVLFFISGLIKVNDITGFGYKLEDYFNVFDSHFGLPAAPFVAISLGMAAVISVLEVIIALTLLLGIYARATAISLLVTIVFFTFLTGYSAITNSVTDCGCFGDALKLTPWQSFSKDIVLIFLIGYIYLGWRYIQPIANNLKLANSLALGGTAIVVFLTWFCYWHLPIVDFRPACVCCNLKENGTKMDAEGNTKLNNYTPFADDCGVDEFSGNTLLIIMKDVSSLTDERVKETTTLAESLKGTDIKVMGGTAASTDELNAFKQKYNINYCLVQRDKTMLKTVIRSNPGYILLKDGIVVGKWHYHDLPDKATLQQTINTKVCKK